MNANIPTNSSGECGDTKKPVSILLMKGTNDTINPYEGGEVIFDGKIFGAVISAEQNLNYWLDVSNCIRQTGVKTLLCHCGFTLVVIITLTASKRPESKGDKQQGY